MNGVIFVEEPSAEIVVCELLRRYEIADRLIVVPHEGKNDLEDSFRRKVPAWKYPADARFVISRDNDGGNCVLLKQRLINNLAPQYHPRVRIRIVMQELESWYLGDHEALNAANLITDRQAERMANEAKFRNPERLNNSAQLVKDLTGLNGKLELARRISPHLLPDRNRAPSFRQFWHAIMWAARNDPQV